MRSESYVELPVLLPSMLGRLLDTLSQYVRLQEWEEMDYLHVPSLERAAACTVPKVANRITMGVVNLTSIFDALGACDLQLEWQRDSREDIPRKKN